MSIGKDEEIEEEIHDVNQFICVEEGRGKKSLKIYTLYASSEKRYKTIHTTREDTIEDEEYFNKKTTE